MTDSKLQETPIKRYDLEESKSSGFYKTEEMTLRAFGEWVRYEDHQRELAAKDAEIEASRKLANIYRGAATTAVECEKHTDVIAPCCPVCFQERIAHLEALLVAQKEEAAKVCESSFGLPDILACDPIAVDSYGKAQHAARRCAEHIRALPLPDKRAEKIKAVVEAAKQHYDEHGYTRCPVCIAVSVLEAEK